MHMPINTVVGDIEFSANEPFGEGRIGPVQYFGEVGIPVQIAGLFGPKPKAIVFGLVVKAGFPIGLSRKFRARRKMTILVQQVRQCFILVVRHGCRPLSPSQVVL